MSNRSHSRPWIIILFDGSRCLVSIFSVSLHTVYIPSVYKYDSIFVNKSSAEAEMGDRGHNRHRQKREGAVVPLSRGVGSPSNTIWSGPRSTSVPSGVFNHPSV